MKNPPGPITQNADIRYLGRLLGDVIRAYGGDALFERIEGIRAGSVDRYRGVTRAGAPGHGLDALSLDDTLAFVRGFMLFSMLANLAEDRQGGAERLGPGRREPRCSGSPSEGVERSEAAALLDRALIVPVLTAHPTEVMRKSMIDHRNRIAELMRQRDRGPARDAARRCRRAGDPAPDRAAVADAAAAPRAHPGGRRSGDRAVLPARRVPAGAAATVLRAGSGCCRSVRSVSCGSASWIGGDRDGNPNVTAATAAARAAARLADAAGRLSAAAARARRGALDLDRAGHRDRRGAWRSREAQRRQPARSRATSPIAARCMGIVRATAPRRTKRLSDSRAGRRSGCRRTAYTQLRRNCARTWSRSPTA